MRASGLLATAALVALAACLLFLAGGPILTDDVWWHLAMGEVYATQGPWPPGDPLLHTAHADAPVQHEWLFGVAVWGVHQVAGFGGLRAAHALAALGTLMLALRVFRRAAPTGPCAAAAAATFVWLAWWRLFQLRPDLASIPAALAVYLLLLERDEPPSPGRITAYLALMVVWGNLHSLFAIGLALPLAALVGLALDAFLGEVAPGRPGAGLPAAARRFVRDARARRIAVALALGALATALNPRGFEQHLTFFTSSAEAGIWRVHDEWTPFRPFALPARSQEVVSVPVWLIANGTLAAFAATALTAGVQLAARRGDASARRAFDAVGFGLGVAGVVALLVSVRFLWMGAFPLLYVLRGLPREEPTRSRVTAVGALGAAALAASLPVTGSFPIVAANLPPSLRGWIALPYVSDKYYLEGVAFLRDAGLEGNLYNKYVMGGFLGYWLAPRLRTFVDSRTEHYTTEVLREYTRVALRRGAGPGEAFEEALERRGVDLFFGVGVPNAARRDASLYTAEHLHGHSGWILVSRSPRHALWLRRNARNDANLARVEAFYRREGVPFDPERGLDARVLLGDAAAWAVARRWLPADVPALLAARASPDESTRFRALDRLALLHALLGSYEDALALAREAAALRPDALGPWRRIAYALLRLDRPGEAYAAAGELVRRTPRAAPAAAAAKVVETYARRRSAELARGPGLEPAAALPDRFPLLDDDDAAWIRSSVHGAVLGEGRPRAGGRASSGLRPPTQERGEYGRAGDDEPGLPGLRYLHGGEAEEEGKHAGNLPGRVQPAGRSEQDVLAARIRGEPEADAGPRVDLHVEPVGLACEQDGLRDRVEHDVHRDRQGFGEGPFLEHRAGCPGVVLAQADREITGHVLRGRGMSDPNGDSIERRVSCLRRHLEGVRVLKVLLVELAHEDGVAAVAEGECVVDDGRARGGRQACQREEQRGSKFEPVHGSLHRFGEEGA